MPLRRIILGIRAFGVLLLALGVPVIAVWLLRAIMRQEVRALADGHPDGVLGILLVLVEATLGAIDARAAQGLLACAAGMFLICVSAQRAGVFAKRLGAA